jgi:hypothetical protein
MVKVSPYEKAWLKPPHQRIQYVEEMDFTLCPSWSGDNVVAVWFSLLTALGMLGEKYVLHENPMVMQTIKPHLNSTCFSQPFLTIVTLPRPIHHKH